MSIGIWQLILVLLMILPIPLGIGSAPQDARLSRAAFIARIVGATGASLIIHTVVSALSWGGNHWLSSISIILAMLLAGTSAYWSVLRLQDSSPGTSRWVGLVLLLPPIGLVYLLVLMALPRSDKARAGAGDTTLEARLYRVEALVRAGAISDTEAVEARKRILAEL